MQSLILDFDKSPSFMRKWNKEFDVEDINSNCFYIVLADDVCDDNITDCLNSDGGLKYSDEHLLLLECKLKYEDNGDNIHISLDEELNLTFPITHNGEDIDNFNVKGLFVTNDTGYVMGYSINTYSMNINNQFIMEKGLTLWSILEDNTYGE